MQQPRDTIPIAKLIRSWPIPTASSGSPRGWRSSRRHRTATAAASLAISDPSPRLWSKACWRWSGRPKLDERQQDELLAAKRAICLTEPLDPTSSCDLLRLIELTYLLGPRKAEATASARAAAGLARRLFSTSTDSPANRETARLLAFLDEPRAVAAIVQHQATVSDLKAADSRRLLPARHETGLDTRNEAAALGLVSRPPASGKADTASRAILT